MYTTRKNPRAKGFDYRSPLAYLVTICTHQKKHLFGHANSDMMIELSSAGLIVDGCVRELNLHFPYVQLDLHQIMPNHLHLILRLQREYSTSSKSTTFRNDTKGTISTIIGSLKSACTSQIRANCLVTGPVWQRSFHDRILFREEDLLTARQYVANNPVAWCAEKV